MKQLLAAALLDVCLFAAVAAAQTPEPHQPQAFVVTRTDAAIVLDGALDERAWHTATAIALRYEYFPGDNTPAPAATICRVTFDAVRLYVGCEAADVDPRALRANLVDRDNARQDDTVGFYIDPFNDGRRAFQFRVNPRGVQMDAINDDVDDEEDWSWDAIWDAATRVSTSGYTAEFSVPFSSLRFPRTAGVQTWGFMASRDMPRSTRHRMRSAFVDRNRQCPVCQFDRISGFTGIEPGRNIEIDPTVTMARTDRASGGSLAAGDPDVQAGVSARWSVRPNVALSGTINPDFYQVEADAAQLDVNTQFQLYFPEKRPFFLEGADLFSTPLPVVFTRTIADPIAGLKLTGKEGAHAFGVFAARDDVTGILVPGFESSSFHSLDRGLTATALRYRRDVGQRGSTLGVLYTGRDGDEYGNHVGGVDGLVRFSNTDSLRFQWLGSRTEYAAAVASAARQSATPFTGQAFEFDYEHETRNWEWGVNAGGRSRRFRADSGFIPQVDTLTQNGYLLRSFTGDATRWFNDIDALAACDRTTDWSGENTSWGCDFVLEYEGPKQMMLSYNPSPNFDRYRGVTYENVRHNINANIRPTGALSVFLNLTLGGAVDLANAQEAERVRMTIGGDYQFFGRLTGRASYSLQELDVAGGRLFTARLTQGQAVYHLTRRTFVRAILQYTDIDRDPALYRSPPSRQTRQLFTQWLFSYKVNPQTAILAGYSDNSDAARSVDLLRTDRTFFLKMGYAFMP